MLEEDYFRRIAQRFLGRRASSRERIFLESYYKEYDTQSDASLSPEERVALQNRLFAKINTTTPVLKVKPLRVIYLARVAAVIVGGFSILALVDKSRLQDLIDPVQYLVTSTDKGKQKVLTLTDGSRVWLNSGSTLRFPRRFNRASREVFLDGEGYFEVAKDKKHPFLVHTGRLVTKVLGTEFDVKAYIGSSTFVVTLVKGKVMMVAKSGAKNAPFKSMLLAPGEKGTFKPRSGGLMPFRTRSFVGRSLKNSLQVKKESVDELLIKNSVIKPIQASLWREGKMYFDGDVLGDVIPALERHYNVTIAARPALLGVPVHVYIGDERPDAALLHLCNSLNREYAGKKGLNYDKAQVRTQHHAYYIE